MVASSWLTNVRKKEKKKEKQPQILSKKWNNYSTIVTYLAA